EEDELYRDVNINQGRGIQATLEVEDSHVTLTLVNPDGQQQSSSVSSQFVTSMPNLTLDVGMELIFETTSQMDVPTPTSVTLLPMSAPTFAGAVSTIPGIIHRYMDLQLIQTVHVAVQLQSDKLHEEAQKENDEFLKTIDENMQTIIKEQVKEQVKVQVSKILPRIEQNVNEQLEAKVLTRSSHSSKTSYAIAADLSKMELKKILIEKMEGNKSIQLSDEQRNLYKALVESYEFNKIILDTYREMVTLKRRHDDDADKDEEPSAGPDRGSKRRREGKEPESASALTETATRSAGSHKYTTSITKTKAADYGHIKWIDDLVPRTMWIEEPIGYDKHALWGVSHWGRKRQPFYGFAVNRESARDVYSKRRIIAVTELKIRRVEDLQLGVERYQKKLNLTKSDSYRSNLKRMEAYTTYSNPRGFIYQNKDKKNRLMRIDELHKFSDGTLTDVRTALDDRLKGIQMQYLPQLVWWKSDKDRAAAMIQAIDNRLKTRRIMRNLERFVGGRLYEGDFRMLQRTI
nr:hypothetical protein [Tanacetum cinerariifolium]